MELIDSCVFIRHITGDHPVHSFLATRILDEIGLGLRDGYTTATAIAETVHVLESPANRYLLTGEQIRDAILPQLQLDHLTMDHRGLFPEIFDWYVRTPADFVDCYHAVLARELGLDTVVTFDRHFRHFPFIRRRRS